MSTAENLKAAFAGESQANRRYLAFAKKADGEGFPQVAKLFRAAAEAETIHALNHLRVLGGVKSTAENVQAAVDGEGYEFQTMYPGFLAEAKTEGNKGAANAFSDALAAEKVHFGLYSAALEALKGSKDLTTTSVWVCPVCGNIEYGAAPARCSICSTPGSKWFEVK
jgi:rubrerythrin